MEILAKTGTLGVPGLSFFVSVLPGSPHWSNWKWNHLTKLLNWRKSLTDYNKRRENKNKRKIRLKIKDTTGTTLQVFMCMLKEAEHAILLFFSVTEKEKDEETWAEKSPSLLSYYHLLEWKSNSCFQSLTLFWLKTSPRSWI